MFISAPPVVLLSTFEVAGLDVLLTFGVVTVTDDVEELEEVGEIVVGCLSVVIVEDSSEFCENKML